MPKKTGVILVEAAAASPSSTLLRGTVCPRSPEPLHPAAVIIAATATATALRERWRDVGFMRTPNSRWRRGDRGQLADCSAPHSDAARAPSSRRGRLRPQREAPP